jgi:RNA polymerase sigma factor (sigma-70 family)
MAELLRRHWDTAVALAGRVLGSPDLGRDAAQEAAIAAMTDLDRLRSPDKFGAWFCGITLNVSRSWLRQLQSEVSGLPPDLISATPDPAEAAEIADTAVRVRDAIAALADGQRDAVRLFYLQCLSHREVAEELGVSVGAVKARLHQARAALADRLAQFHPPLNPPRKENMVTASDTAKWVEVVVSEIRRSQEEDPRQRKHVMILTERGGGRTLPIWIGPAEATVLALALESVETPRPFTYKLAISLVEAAGSQITEVRVTRLTGSIFYASVVVPGRDGQREVDARPSDAVNLAVACDAPIHVRDELFESSGDDGSVRLSSLLTATAEIAAEYQQRMREETERQERRPLRVPQAKYHAAEDESGRSPQGDHSQALPRRERQTVQPGRGLTVQARGQRADLL